MSFFENTRKPAGFGGKLMVVMMNLGHSPVARWGFTFWSLLRTIRYLTAAAAAGQISDGC